jgi:hypothetical protein
LPFLRGRLIGENTKIKLPFLRGRLIGETWCPGALVSWYLGVLVAKNDIFQTSSKVPGEKER